MLKWTVRRESSETERSCVEKEPDSEKRDIVPATALDTQRRRHHGTRHVRFGYFLQNLWKSMVICKAVQGLSEFCPSTRSALYKKVEQPEILNFNTVMNRCQDVGGHGAAQSSARPGTPRATESCRHSEIPKATCTGCVSLSLGDTGWGMLVMHKMLVMPSLKIANNG